jgi:TolB-like protein
MALIQRLKGRKLVQWAVAYLAASPVQSATSRVAEDGRPAIARPPFDNVSPSPDGAHFADGVHEEISELSKVSALRVVSRNPVMWYREEKKPFPPKEE